MRPGLFRTFVACLALVLIATAVSVSAKPDFPKLTGRVVDDAGMLSSGAQARLTRMLAALEQANGDQVVVVTLPDLGGDSIETYGYQLGRAWGIGQKKKNNGALLIIAKKERAIRIEVGYGLEGQLTDARSSVIIHQVIEPAFKKGDFDAGVLQGTAAIVQLLGGKPPSELVDQASQAIQHHQSDDRRPSLGHTLMFFVLDNRHRRAVRRRGRGSRRTPTPSRISAVVHSPGRRLRRWIRWLRRRRFRRGRILRRRRRLRWRRRLGWMVSNDNIQ